MKHLAPARGFAWAGLGAYLLLLGSASCGQQAVRPNVILITVDTLRADHLGSHGYARPTTPALDALALKGLRFTQARSQAPWTLPSMASLHTSLYPSEHGAISARTALPPGSKTLAEVLGQAGYHCSGVVSHIFVGSKYGLDQGFDDFEELENPLQEVHEVVTSEALTMAARKSFEAHLDGPQFLWVHYFDPHFTYVRHAQIPFEGSGARQLGDRIDYEHLKALTKAHPEGLPAATIEEVKSAYDEEVAHTDHWIGELVKTIRAAAGERPTVFVITADHGESFHERGRFGHDRDLYDELIHVPLILAGGIPPELRGQIEETPVELTSIAATITWLCGIDAEEFRGQNLLQANLPQKLVFSEASHAWAPPAHKKTSVVWGPWKLIHRRDDDGLELYNLLADPAEQENLLLGAQRPKQAARLLRELRSFEAKVQRPGSIVILDEAKRAHLRALGYTED